MLSSPTTWSSPPRSATALRHVRGEERSRSGSERLSSRRCTPTRRPAGGAPGAEARAEKLPAIPGSRRGRRSRCPAAMRVRRSLPVPVPACLTSRWAAPLAAGRCVPPGRGAAQSGRAIIEVERSAQGALERPRSAGAGGALEAVDDVSFASGGRSSRSSASRARARPRSPGCCSASSRRRRDAYGLRRDRSRLSGTAEREPRAQVQMVFQDPTARWIRQSASTCIAELIGLLGDSASARRGSASCCEQVGLARARPRAPASSRGVSASGWRSPVRSPRAAGARPRRGGLGARRVHPGADP